MEIFSDNLQKSFLFFPTLGRKTNAPGKRRKETRQHTKEYGEKAKKCLHKPVFYTSTTENRKKWANARHVSHFLQDPQYNVESDVLYIIKKQRNVKTCEAIYIQTIRVS